VPVWSSIRGIVLSRGQRLVISAQDVDALPVYRKVMGEGVVPRYYVEMSAVRSIGEMSGTRVRNQGSVYGEVCNNNNWDNEQAGDNEGEVRNDDAGRPGSARAVSDVNALG